MRVSLVIRCLNEEAHIGRLLTGVQRQRRRPDEIVIVDSGSTDATLAIASAFGAEIVKIAPEDFSFGRALNAGLAAISVDIAVLASAHVYPIYENWIERLLAPFAEPRVALSYGRQQVPPGGRFSEKRLLERWFPAKSVPAQTNPFCNNANAAIRHSVWEQLRYGEELTGLEDVDWAKRALADGHLLSYVSEAPVVHVHDESFSQVLNRYRREALAHKLIYPDQSLGLRATCRLYCANVLTDLRAAHAEGRLVECAADIVGFRSAQFLGTHEGFSQEGAVTHELRRRFYYPSRPAGPVVSEPGSGRPIDYDEPLP